MATTLPISKIRTDGGTQPRAVIDFDAVNDYFDAMQSGVKFPPVTVFYDGTDYWLADGFHRCQAASSAEIEEIACDIQQGTQQDAQWYSFSANKTNGLRRSNDDKQRAVRAALLHPNGAEKSDSAIAKHVGVDTQTVANWRKKTESSSEIRKMDTRTVTRNGTTYQQNTANIGKRVEISRSEPEPPRQTPPAPAPRLVSRPEPVTYHPDPEPEPESHSSRVVVDLLRCIFDLAEHGVSASDLVKAVPDQNIAVLYQKSRNAFEFVGFVFEAAGKRQKGVA